MKDLLLNANALNANNANNANNTNVNNVNILNRNLHQLDIDEDDHDDVYIQEEPDFGVMFDIDGVLARGTEPLQAAVNAFKLLTDENHQLRVPVAFVTNACNRSADKAAQIQSWLGIDVTPDMVVHSPTPLKIMEDLHDKHILLVGQGPVRDVALELGFTNYCLLDDITDAYPLLDMVNHENRKAVARGYVEKDFPPVEAIILLGEPIKWESYLQVIIDLLLTGGKPNQAISTNTEVEQIPVIACNMDLTFMHKANMPRFGHGAFLVCLEALYKKITGNELEYSRLVGKPCEIQYRYGEHIVNTVREKIGYTTPITKLYFIGDNPNVDVMGANMYNNYLKAKYSRRQSVPAATLPSSRVLPINDNLTEQTATTMYSLLVSTGVYRPSSTETTTTSSATDNDKKAVYHGHRDIERKPSLTRPTKLCRDVYDAVEFMMQHEGMLEMYS
ncbi:haloacid dehalogenase-like hydrolase domain-containing 5 [Octopus bimaculoides]|nr:haloacid dehalogenase-like hydrolase domain-containing 5 [Octopus bimaculoides]